MMRISHLYEKDEEDEDEEKEEKELEEGEIIENEYPQVSVFHGTSSHNTSDSNNTCSNNGDLNMMLCSDLDQDVLAVSSPPSLNALTSEAMGLYRSPNKFDQECSFSSDDEVEGGNHGNGGRRDGDIKKTPLPISRFLMDNNSGGGDNDGHKCEDNNDDDDDDAMFNELVDFEGGAGSKDSQLDDDLSAKLGAIRLGGGGGKISFAATPGKSTASVSSSTMETAAVSRTPGPLGSALRQTTPFSTRSRRDCVAAGMERVVMDLLMEQHEIPTLSDDEGEEEEEEVEDESNVLNQDMHPSQQPQTSYLNKNANSKKKMLGVRFNVENQPLHDTIEKNVDAAGSVVIVMTPVRAKKKEREGNENKIQVKEKEGSMSLLFNIISKSLVPFTKCSVWIPL